MHSPLGASLISIAIAIFTAPSVAQIEWSQSLDKAMARAKAEKRAVFVAINSAGKRSSDLAIKIHFRDPSVIELSKNTINVFCDDGQHKKSGTCSRCRAHACSDHRNSYSQAKRKIKGLAEAGDSIVPQMIFLDSDGKVLLSKSRSITTGELEWMWAQAIQSMQPQFTFEVNARTRAPSGFKKGAVDTSKGTPSPSKRDIEKALEAVKKLAADATGGGRRNRGRGARNFVRAIQQAGENSDTICHSSDRRAMDWAKSTLATTGRFGTLRRDLIQRIGKNSPPAWSKVVEPYLSDDSEDTRKAAVIALEQLANKRSLAPLRKHAKKEEDQSVEGRFYRAMASCAPTHRGTIQTIEKVVEKSKLETVRAHAVVAAGILEDREAVTELLRHALQDDSSLVRSVAAFVIASRQDKILLPFLEASTKAETDADTKDVFEKALQVIKTTNPAELEGYLENTIDKQANRRANRRRNRSGDDKGKGKDKGKATEPGTDGKEEAGGKNRGKTRRRSNR